ncbi:MAG: hypothetical protein ACLUIQ_11585 [Dialister invisus]
MSAWVPRRSARWGPSEALPHLLTAHGQHVGLSGIAGYGGRGGLTLPVHGEILRMRLLVQFMAPCLHGVAKPTAYSTRIHARALNGPRGVELIAQGELPQAVISYDL